MSSSPPATLTAEEVEAVTMSGEALLQLASRLNGVAFLPSSTSQAGGRMRGDHDSHDGGGDAPFVTVEDGAGFMELLRDVIEHCPANLQARDESHYEQRECGAHNEGRSPHAATMLQKRLLALHHVVFGLQPELLATVLSLLHAPHMMTDGDAVCHLFQSALLLLQTVVFSCCIPSEHLGQGWRASYVSVEAMELSATCTDLLDRLGAVGIVSDFLYDDFPLTVRLAAAQLLFIMLLRDGSTVAQAKNSYVRDALSSPERLSILMTVLTSTDAYKNSAAAHATVRNLTTDDVEMPENGASHSNTLTETGRLSATSAGLPDLCLSLRLHIAACVRELANSHYSRLTGPEILDVLLRLSDTDPSGDLRALCIESMHVILRHCAPSEWATVSFKKELAALCATQLGREGHHDALHATLCLLETLILRDALDNSAGDISKADDGEETNRELCLCESLLMLFADRALAALIGDAVSPLDERTKKHSSGRSVNESQPRHRDPTCHSTQDRPQFLQGRKMATRDIFCNVTTVSCLAARCLRLLVQHAPYYRNGAFYLVQHRSSLSRLLETSVRLAAFHEIRCRENASGSGYDRGISNSIDFEGGGDGVNVDEAPLVLAVELAILVGLCLAQDPRARQLVAAEFCNFHVEAQQMRSALISNLNLVSLSYFGDAASGDIFEIMDVTGVRLNTLDAVMWDTPDRPSRAAVHRLFTTQESRWNKGELRILSLSSRINGNEDLADFSDGDGGKQGRENDVNATMNNNGNKGDNREGKTREGDMYALLQTSDHQRLQRLTFIVLSYAIHYTFKTATGDAAAATRFAAAFRGMADDSLRELLATLPSPSFKTASAVEEQRRTSRVASTAVATVPAAAIHDSRAQKKLRYYDAYMLDAGKQVPEAKGQKSSAKNSFLVPARRGQLQGPRDRLTSSAPMRGASSSSSTSTKTDGEEESAKNAPDGPAPVNAEAAHLILQFHRGLRLFRDLAQFYNKHPTSMLSRTAVYQATEEKGMVRRQGKCEAQRTIAKILQEAEDASLLSQQPTTTKTKTTTTAQPPQRQRGRVTNLGLIGVNTRSWSINELQEGDLFYFCIPHAQLTTEALQYTRRRAMKHSRHLKKVFAITPQSAKSRRWLLHDAIANIMPGVVHAISQFIQWFEVHGEENVKLPILIYFEDDVGCDDDDNKNKSGPQRYSQDGNGREDSHPAGKKRRSGGGGRSAVLPSVPSSMFRPTPSHPQGQGDASVALSLPRAEEVALHAGNLISLLQQVAFYLQRRDQLPHPEDGFRSREFSTFVASPMPRKGEDTGHPSHASPSITALQHDTGGAGTPIRAVTNSASPLLTARKSVFLRDIEREIERLQKLDICGDENGTEAAGGFLLPEMAVSPYGDTLTPHAFGKIDGFSRYENDDDIIEEDEEEFDELKGGVER
ncbi:hypothetical protein TCSYLVIO_000895 [Trypanosoma cruzi]|nr:hypothetical protein TCSYLVIO_000895 [Trypanosoma cruzi]